ncbi:MAG TPA: cytochrome C biogenesis protein [Sulfurospirillum sp. UBA11407]|jgi:DNA-binding response OmpR family regulator|nr:MAG TPA: cytochrome C biogenesis protein [Sulfurospirillum sp. UBA11407]DAB33397.1 MAG TPA: cytochrome C biogenesis protein [Sulfurospirillum sp. UBA12182]
MSEILSLFEDMTILYAEDEDSLRQSVSQTLEIFFKKVIPASNGEEAIELFWEHTPDILLLDICMPKLDGIKMLEQIRKSNKKTPVIIMSAHTDQAYFLKAIELNICKYLIKPFSKNSFIEALEATAKWMFEWGDGYQITLAKDTFYTPISAQIKFANHSYILTKKEKQLFEYLLRQKDRVVSFEELEEFLWNDYESHKEALKALIKELRKKLPQGIIENVFATGYRLVSFK